MQVSDVTPAETEEGEQSVCKACGKLEFTEIDELGCCCPLPGDHIMQGTFRRGWIH